MLSSLGLVCQDGLSDVLVWFGLSNWDGQVGFVRSGPVSLVGIVESR